MMNFIEDTVEENSDIAKSEIIGLTENNRLLKVIKLRSGNPTKSVWIGKKRDYSLFKFKIP